MKIQQYPRNADGTPMDLTAGVFVDETGNGGARFIDVPKGPDGAPIDVVGLVMLNPDGTPYQPTTNDEPYGPAWNGSLKVPSQNAVYDKLEELFTSAPPVEIFINNNTGSDANNGTSPDTPVKSWVQAIALMEPRGKFRPARGSVWYGESPDFWNNSNCDWTSMIPYGQGNYPVLDGGLAFVGPWIADGTAWYHDITFAEPTFGNSFPSADLSPNWKPALYDETSRSRVEESGVTRYLEGATQADNIAYVKANPGTFTVVPIGSGIADARLALQTQFRFYYRPTDSSNPNTNGRTLRTVDQRHVCSLGKGMRIEETHFRRSGSKDFIATYLGVVGPESFQKCRFTECGGHGMVLGGVELRNCVVKAAYHGDSKAQGCGGIHNFRATSTYGRSLGVKIFDCEVEGFAHATYSHGAGVYAGDGTDYEHETFDIDGLLVRNCLTIAYAGSTARGILARKIKAYKVYSIGVALAGEHGTLIEDSEIYITDDLSVDEYALFELWEVKAKARLKNTFVYKTQARSTNATELMDPLPLGGGLAKADMPTLILENSTVSGMFNNPGNATRQQINITLINSVLGIIMDTGAGDDLWITGDIVADATSSIEFERSSIDRVRSLYPGVAAGAYTGVRKQMLQKTVLSTDLVYVNVSGYQVSYSGTDNGDGTANLTSSVNVNGRGRYIKVVDAYGAGLHYFGKVISDGAISSDPLIVAPPPTGAFSNKSILSAVFKYEVFKDTPVTASLSTDGLTLTVPDGTLFLAGMTINVSALTGTRKSAFGVRKITVVAGNDLTLDEPCLWKLPYNNVSYAAGRRELPTVTVGFGFPLLPVSNDANTWNTPRIEVVPEEGGGTKTATQTNNSTGQFNLGDVSFFTYPKTFYRADGTGNVTQDHSIDYERGNFEVGVMLRPNDVVRYIADAEIPQERLTFLTPPDKSLMYLPDPNCLPAKRGAGYRGRVAL